MNLFHKQADMVPGKGTKAEMQETRASQMILYSRSDALSVMSHTNKVLHLIPNKGEKNMGIK